MDLSIKTFDFVFSQLDVDRKRIVRGMGYNFDDCPKEVIHLTDKLLLECRSHLSIKAGYKIIDPLRVKISKGHISLEDVEFNIKNVIWAHVRKSKTIAIFACSLGNKYDEWIHSFYDKHDSLAGYVADVIGSEVVEAAADLIEQEINKEAGLSGYNCSNRLSPGYCEWNVSDQHNLFSLLPKNFCGIKLTDSALMVPIKSVSGIIGIGEEIKKLDYQCSICNIDHCYKKQRILTQ